jgi:hypothetical protein
MRLLVTGPYFTVVFSLDFSSTCGIMYFADALKKPFGARGTYRIAFHSVGQPQGPTGRIVLPHSSARVHDSGGSLVLPKDQDS